MAGKASWASNGHGKGSWGAKGHKGGDEADAPPSSNLYVCDLPAEADEEFLKALFAQVGSVMSIRMFPQHRYGFVRLASIEEAQAAISAADGLECHGTILKVKFAKDKASGSASAASSVVLPGKGKGGKQVSPWAVSPEPHVVPHPPRVVPIPPGRQAPAAPPAPARLLKPQVLLKPQAPGAPPKPKVVPLPAKQPHVVPHPGQAHGAPQIVPIPPHALAGEPPAQAGAASERGKGGKEASTASERGKGEEEDATPSDNLYVWQLPEDCDESYLRELFGQVGTVVSVKCMPDKRCGFVRFETEEEATTALHEINFLDCNDTTIRVKYKHDKPKGAGKGKEQPSQSAPAATPHIVEPPVRTPAPVCRIFVEELPPVLSVEDVAGIFDRYCSGVECEVLTEAVAMLILPQPEAEWIVANLNGNIPQGLNAPIHVSMAHRTGVRPQRVPPSYGKADGAPHSRSSPYGKGDRGQPESGDTTGTNVYAYQLPYGCDDMRLGEIFAEYGTVITAKCFTEKRYGFVNFSSNEEAQDAISAVNGLSVDGSSIVCQFAKPKKS